MRYTIFAVSIITLLAATPVLAADSPKEERVGVGTGAVIGAVAGGPVGFIIGAAIGAKIGDTVHKKNESIDALSGSLEDSRDRVARLSNDVDTLGSEIERMRQVSNPEAVNLLQAGIAMDFLFRTDEHTLADTTGGRLAELAGILATTPDIRIQLDGFADERGDKDYNLVLSQKRVEFVRDQLVAAGIDPSRIQTSAYGEAAAQDQDVDSYALERRVNMKVFIDNSRSFASNPNQAL